MPATPTGTAIGAQRWTSADVRVSRSRSVLPARTMIATSGATKTALYAPTSTVSVTTPRADSTAARIAAKYGNAVGSSTAMIPAPSSSVERPSPGFTRSSSVRTRARSRHSTAARHTRPAPTISSTTWRAAAGAAGGGGGAEPCQQGASDRKKEHNPPERRHEKDTGREGNEATWGARPEGQHDGRNDSGWIQRIQRCNRDDENDDPGHAASFS